jgi:hypothetical protein
MVPVAYRRARLAREPRMAKQAAFGTAVSPTVKLKKSPDAGQREFDQSSDVGEYALDSVA